MMSKYPRRHMTPGKVKRIIDAELKFKDVNVNGLTIPSLLGNLFSLSAIDTGDGESERIGNWVKPVSLHGAITVQADETSAEPLQRFRVFIVQWRENQDIDVASLEKLVQNTSQPYLGYNVQSKGAFKVLWTWVGAVISNTDNPQYAKTRRFYVKPRTKILYDGDGPRKYQIFMAGISDIAALDAPPSFTFSSRLRYTDS